MLLGEGLFEGGVDQRSNLWEEPQVPVSLETRRHEEVLAALRQIAAAHLTLADVIGAVLAREDAPPVVNVETATPALDVEHLATAIAAAVSQTAPPAQGIADAIAALGKQQSSIVRKLNALGTGGGGGGTVSIAPGQSVGVREAFASCEYLADQTPPPGGGVCEFAFSAGVQLVWVRVDGGNGRVDPHGGAPGPASGVFCRDGEPTPLPVETQFVNVHVTDGGTAKVWGYRY